MTRVQLGDTHNFGRRVTQRGGWVAKPRTVFWEWLLLGKTSPLRPLLRDIGWKTGLGDDAFGFVPALDFSRPRAAHGGRVSVVDLRPLPAPSRLDQLAFARTVGRAVALYAWLGLGDLHWENLALGLDEERRVVFGPLDVELVLGDFELPTETRLLPEADEEYGDVYAHAAGIRRVLPWLGKPVRRDAVTALVEAYAQALTALEAHAGEVARLIAKLPGHAEAPIRVTLRGTDEYVRARSVPPWPPLLAAEAEQLARGDIPYFFCLYGRSRLHFYANRALTELGTLPSRGDVPRAPPLLSLARGLRSRSRARLREEGALALRAAFARGGSVYLPCRCGEVRTVLVPRVTRCSAKGAS